ncbi:MAG: potassium transporter TrkG, partial [[Clostridium] scindens]
MQQKKQNIRWNTMRILVFGFLGVIFVGAVLLWLPISNQQPIAFMDSLFTATSAVCVTGLVTITPAAQFTVFGKVILLFLIQIGGLGVIACATVFFLILRRQITVRERVVIQETYN